MDSFYTYNPETAKRVPLAQIDFENPLDPDPKGIKEQLPNWNISTMEVNEFLRKKYYPEYLFRSVTPQELLDLLLLLWKIWEYLTPEEERGEAVKFHDGANMATVFEDTQGKIERRGVQYRIHSGSGSRAQQGRNYVVRGCWQCLCHMVRLVLKPKFLARLLEKSRALLTENEALDLLENLKVTPDPATETAPETAAEAAAEAAAGSVPKTAQETYGPFSSHKEASDSMLRCIHLILMDHFTNFDDGYSFDDPESTDRFLETGQYESPSHWSQLYQYLQKDLERNEQQVPPRLEFFFESVKFGAKLERITPAEADELFDIRDQGKHERFISDIMRARAVYHVNYEMW